MLPETSIQNLVYSRKGYAISVFGNRHDAEDALQTIVLRILRNKEKFATFSPDKQVSYLLRSIHNSHIDLKRQKKRKEQFLRRSAKDYADPEVYEKYNMEELTRLINQFSYPNEFLMNFHGYTTKEIAQRSGIKETTALQRCYNARKFLKANLLALMAKQK